MNYILFDKVTKSYGYEKIFDNLSLKILKNEHIGLIGSNGCGKTTFFRMITGDEYGDSGRIIVRKDIHIGYLEQSASDYDGKTIRQILMLPFTKTLEAMASLSIYEKKLSNADDDNLKSLLDEYGKLQSFVEFNDGYNIESRIMTVANGIGIDTSRLDDSIDVLSGGERTRVFLGKLLLEEPELLLLDEPTNHLDLVAVSWLEQFITAYKGTVVIVSHDRTFLDNSVTKIIEIENKKASEYPGNYSFYKLEKQRRTELLEKQYEGQQKEIQRLEKAAKQMREWAGRADNEKMYKRAVNVEKRIEHIDKIEKPFQEKISMRLDLKNTRKSGKEIIKLDNLCKSYSGMKVLKGIDLLIRRGEKVVVSGENGSGKSTIANIIMGTIQAEKGDVKVGDGVRAGYLPQDVSFEDETRSLLEETQRALGSDAPKAHKILAAYGFRGEHVMKKIDSLSGGERKRLYFCHMMQQEYNLLIMDEPTNHMDIHSREILENALTGYKGTCLFISHDRFFINKVSSQRYLLMEGLLMKYEGDYTKIIERKKHTDSENPTYNRTSESHVQSKNRKAAADEIENRIRKLESEVSLLSHRMQKTMPLDNLNKLHEEKLFKEDRLTKLYEDWEKTLG